MGSKLSFGARSINVRIGPNFLVRSGTKNGMVGSFPDTRRRADKSPLFPLKQTSGHRIAGTRSCLSILPFSYAAAIRFLRHPIRLNRPRPPAKSGSVAGRGTAETVILFMAP